MPLTHSVSEHPLYCRHSRTVPGCPIGHSCTVCISRDSPGVSKVTTVQGMLRHRACVGHPGIVWECPGIFSVWGKLNRHPSNYSTQNILRVQGGRPGLVQVTMISGILRHRVCEGQVGHPGIVRECPSTCNYGSWKTAS